MSLTNGGGGDSAIGAGDIRAAIGDLLSTIDDAALVVCGSEALLTGDAAAHTLAINQLRDFVEARPKRDLFLVADAPRHAAAADRVGDAVASARTGVASSNHVAMYWPHIIVPDPVGLGRSPQITIPAAGHIAGVYGRTDGRRGVWKAAAALRRRCPARPPWTLS